jgi:hypothetical protein
MERQRPASASDTFLLWLSVHTSTPVCALHHQGVRVLVVSGDGCHVFTLAAKRGYIFVSPV